ncbi:MAG TPA: S8 family serine peptidase, partial [Saprospiraceae bacterium]|nr:S8 family serine peptidase [Saprospiraceae bacterium]
RWIGVRNMERGWGKPSTYIEGFEWFLAPTDLNNQNPDPDKSPDVINNSWGCPPNEGCDLSNFGVMQDVVANLKAAGIVVVVSAGNAGSGCGSIDDPAAIFEESFSIGATRSNDTIANFSSRGGVSIDGSFRTKPNVSAPGVGVRSCTPGGNYQFFSGTSMAGPHVAGAVALILSAAPELKGQVDVIEDILEQTAIPKYTDQACDSIPGSIVPNNTYGYGRIDVLQAVKLALKTVAANDIEKPKTTVTSFPNPVSNTLYFDVKEFNGDILIEIFDVPGKLIYSSKQQVAGDKLVKCDFQHESTGLYFYKITGQQLCVAGKFVKN